MTLAVDHSFLKQIESGLKCSQAITLETGSNNTVRVKPLGILARLWHWRDPQFHEERFSRLAATVAKIIASQQRLSIAAAAEDPDLKSARHILKHLQAHAQKAALKELKKEITAAKLGISSSTLDSNAGFQAFAEMHHLERYLLGYNHPMQIDPATQEVSLRKEGQLQPWSAISEAMKTWQKPTCTPQWAWVYGAEGIQNKDLYDWKTLTPFIKGNPADWNHQYVFEFCACFNPDSVKNGNHSWLRLKTPEGDIYSVGLYRPGKDSLWDNVKTPLRIKPGYLMQPDVSEFWDYPISTVDFAITEKEFLKIKSTIEADKQKEELVFQIFNNNCMLYGKKLAKIAGVDLPTAEPICQLLTPPTIYRKISTIVEKLPLCIQKIGSYVMAFFLNLSQVFLGACRIDDRLNEQQKRQAVPHLISPWDLCDVRKIYLNHPNTLGTKIRPQVLAWRQQQITELHQTALDQQTRAVKERQLQLSLPPAYYSQPASV